MVHNVLRDLQIWSVLWGTCLTTLLTLIMPALGGDADWLNDVRQAYKNVEKHTENVSAKVTRTDYIKSPGEKNDTRVIRSFEYFKLGESLLFLADEGEQRLRSISGVNPQYYFIIREINPGQLRSLAEVGERSELTLRGVLANQALFGIVEKAKNANNNLTGFPIDSFADLLAFNSKRLKAEKTQLDGREVLLLQGDFAPYREVESLGEGKGPPILKNSKIYLDPALDYRLVLWERRQESNGEEHVTSETFEYNQNLNGYPVLTKSSVKSGTAENGYAFLEIELTDWKSGENKPEIFYLSHYGLEEPSFQRAWIPGWLRIGLIGIAILAGGIWLRRRFRR